MQFASSPGFEPFRRCICERESLNGLDGNGLQSFRLSQWNEIFFERNLSRILFICVFVCFKGRIELPLTDEWNPYLQNEEWWRPQWPQWQWPPILQALTMG